MYARGRVIKTRLPRRHRQSPCNPMQFDIITLFSFFFKLFFASNIILGISQRADALIFFTIVTRIKYFTSQSIYTHKTHLLDLQKRIKCVSSGFTRAEQIVHVKKTYKRVCRTLLLILFEIL